MPERTTPYGAFNFLVTIGGADAGGFSDVSGLTTEIKMAEYRNGNEQENHVRKVSLLHSAGDVTCKRGVIDSTELFGWIEDVQQHGPTAKKDVVISLCDENHQVVQKWILRRCVPIKYTGPTLAAKGGTDVAMEELVLSVEGYTIARP